MDHQALFWRLTGYTNKDKKADYEINMALGSITANTFGSIEQVSSNIGSCKGAAKPNFSDAVVSAKIGIPALTNRYDVKEDDILAYHKLHVEKDARAYEPIKDAPLIRSLMGNSGEPADKKQRVR